MNRRKFKIGDCVRCTIKCPKKKRFLGVKKITALKETYTPYYKLGYICTEQVYFSIELELQSCDDLNFGEAMPYDIIVRFPNKKIADEFCGEMSDGSGEGFCNFSFYRQKPGTDGKKNSDYEEVYDDQKRRVYFVSAIF